MCGKMVQKTSKKEFKEAKQTSTKTLYTQNLMMMM